MAARIPPPSPEYLKFLRPYAPGIVELALATRRLVLEEAPGAVELVYDAYNAVVAGYSFTGRPGDAFIHIPVYANWVNLGFHRGPSTPSRRASSIRACRWPSGPPGSSGCASKRFFMTRTRRRCKNSDGVAN